MTEHGWPLPDEAATAALAARWAATLNGMADVSGEGGNGLVLYLRGELGAGKTSFARALLGALGVAERIKSPTYSLIEGYRAHDRAAWHLDLYRIADPDELQWLGLDALSDPTALVLVEWPERGSGALVAADIELQLDYAGAGRRAKALARSPRGEKFLARLDSPMAESKNIGAVVDKARFWPTPSAS